MKMDGIDNDNNDKGFDHLMEYLTFLCYVIILCRHYLCRRTLIVKHVEMTGIYSFETSK